MPLPGTCLTFHHTQTSQWALMWSPISSYSSTLQRTLPKQTSVVLVQRHGDIPHALVCFKLDSTQSSMLVNPCTREPYNPWSILWFTLQTAWRGNARCAYYAPKCKKLRTGSVRLGLTFRWVFGEGGWGGSTNKKGKFQGLLVCEESALAFWNSVKWGWTHL